MQASVREELDLQLKDSLLEAENLRSELEVRKVQPLFWKCACCVGVCVNSVGFAQPVGRS